MVLFTINVAYKRYCRYPARKTACQAGIIGSTLGTLKRACWTRTLSAGHMNMTLVLHISGNCNSTYVEKDPSYIVILEHLPYAVQQVNTRGVLT
jgi:hypothetical protein